MTEDFSQKALVWRLWDWMIRQRLKMFRQLGRRQKQWVTESLDDWVTGWLSHWMTDALDDWVTGWQSHWLTTDTYWCVLTHTDANWCVLMHTDTYWYLLTFTDTYLHLLTLTDTYWHLLTLTDTYWHLLTLTDTYWQPIITRRPNSQKCRTRLLLQTVKLKSARATSA